MIRPARFRFAASLFLLSLLPALALSSISRDAHEQYAFSNSQQRVRFQMLTQKFRCLVCQNEDLASSNAALAEDLRQTIYDLLVIDNKSDATIIQYMTDRYGTFVLFEPPWQWQTVLLWLAPVFFLLIGLTVVSIVIRRSQR